jgi:hypothetical protein
LGYGDEQREQFESRLRLHQARHRVQDECQPARSAWIDAYNDYFTGKKGDTERRKDLVSALEGIIQKYPNEMEAKTFLAFQIWENEDKGIPSRAGCRLTR